jgi:hypothetical protein
VLWVVSMVWSDTQVLVFDDFVGGNISSESHGTGHHKDDGVHFEGHGSDGVDQWHLIVCVLF